MSLYNTIWLWGLAGLIIPIGIHLLSRRQGKVIKFGSIRHLVETSTRQFKAIRLNEFALLFLRCLFILFLVLMLADLRLNFSEEKNRLLFVESGLLDDAKYRNLIDSLRSIGFEIRDFGKEPGANSHSVATGKEDYWNIVQELKTEDEVVFLSYSFVDGFKGKRVALPAGVRWLSAEPDSVGYDLDINEHSEDSVVVRRANSHRDKTSFSNVISAKHTIHGVIHSPDTISIALVFDSAYEYDKDILVAALQALNSKGSLQLHIDPIPSDNYIPGQHLWTIWIAETTPPETRKNFILLTENERPGRDLFIQTISKQGQSWLLTKRLNEDIALREHLAVQLAMILHPQEKYEDRASEFDRRVLGEKIRWSPFPPSGQQTPQSDNEASSKYICIAMLFTLCLERLLAFKRNQ